MKDEIKEKFNDFIVLIVTIIFDALVVLVVGVIGRGLKFTLENWIFHSKIEDIDNKALLTIYLISKIFLISLFLLYVS